MTATVPSDHIADAHDFLDAFADLPVPSQDAVCIALLQLDGTVAGRVWDLLRRAEALAETVANGRRGYDEALRFRAAVKSFAHSEGMTARCA